MVYKFTNGIVVYTEEQAKEYQKAGMVLVKETKKESKDKEIKNVKDRIEFESKECRPSFKTIR